MTARGWTIAEACREFEAAGMPVDPGRFRIIVRNLPGFRPVGEVRKPPGSLGGRGDFLYEIAELQILHRNLARWLCPQDPPPGDT